MKIDDAWTRFERTGKIEDYLNYCYTKKQPQNINTQLQAEGVISGYAADNRRGCDQGAQYR